MKATAPGVTRNCERMFAARFSISVSNETAIALALGSPHARQVPARAAHIDLRGSTESIAAESWGTTKVAAADGFVTKKT